MSAEEVLAAVAAVGGAVDALAVVGAKAGEPGVAAAAARLGVPLRVAERGGETWSWSAASVRATGVGSASEAAALAAAGPQGRLIGPRLVVGRVTCAVAVTGE